ncbi:hypothetical protein [cf. Phormidesmis sp. LEGE 11477]|uniref:hypothetical protein n=1 Tax=cf. Phormidesmis sp. LEGE 11477 TaxID=1828680 RepID=UPI00187E6A39|nr:hypothetical protein [cf. Phormidesmis sp. LEGE 11477]MBE9065023.1 hypothetical protein [cf. Phormidesmis sp. LEGE 11477]
MEAVLTADVFWLGVLQTTIGATLAFALGLLAFQFQLGTQRAESQKVAKAAANDALFRALQAAILNIETLASIKMQIVADLREESQRMETLVNDYYNADTRGREAALRSMKEASESFHSFYKTTPPPSMLEPPDFNELSLVVRQMPALTNFLHRGTSTFHDVIARLAERNEMIAKHATENDAGMTEHRFVYYMSMLTGLGNSICEHVDDDLAFFMLVRRQAENYLANPEYEGMYASYEIAARAQPFLPDENRFPELNAQVKVFSFNS